MFAIDVYASNHLEKTIKPLKYILYKDRMNRLVNYFDSISRNNMLSVSLSNQKNRIYIGVYSPSKYLIMDLDLKNDSTGLILQSIDISLSDIRLIKEMLESSHAMTIRKLPLEDNTKIELLIGNNFFMDNCKGFIYIKDSSNINTFPSYYKKITDRIFYYKHLPY